MNGMANIAAREGAVMHGVAHLVTPQMFEVLAKIESVYNYTLVTCRPYDDSAPPVQARAFIVPLETIAAHKRHLEERGQSTLELPSERYIRIITEGLRHFGAAPSWIARIEAQPFNPARPRAQWLTAPEAPRSNGEALPLFTLAQLAEHKGRLPAYYACGRKVLRALAPGGHPFSSIYKMLSGTQSVLFMCSVLYDPSLPPVEGPDDVQEVHVAWAEDLAMETALKYDFKLEVVGYLADGEVAHGEGGVRK
ncbi:hypothetical protein MNEG_2083 [Monoraphidium neglectum]|uniref:Uncharacterized protein n=1 Tax=Monoraphidium neglectum TaxID=145388 RepID=A0A0D2NMQ8_9CHLO|nr:hypothetical protein MNEG_2083 [Monoraphidium neglectum]KIZ05876.1 hypothetical protein MNEG_2083 [Monoraphidium neglectum]|eukprot:XP_013904895.1 hypothetical protein MNEG_2083 [Monoraphidium neglectum]